MKTLSGRDYGAPGVAPSNVAFRERSSRSLRPVSSALDPVTGNATIAALCEGMPRRLRIELVKDLIELVTRRATRDI